MPKTNRKKKSFSRYLTIKNEEIEINASKNFGVYPLIMERIVEQLDACFRIHKRVFVVLFILQHRETSQDNKDISKFMNVIKQWVRRKYKTKNIGSVWVREWEKAKAKSHHYHCALYIDGDKVRHPIEILKAIKSKWYRYGNVPDKFLKNCYYNIRKENYDEKRAEVIWRLSYYAKIRGKGYRNPQSSDYQTSRLKLKI
jgi:hypothetical protein